MWFPPLDSSEDFMARGGLRFSLSLIVSASYDVVEQSALLIFGTAAITLGTGPHSYLLNLLTYTQNPSTRHHAVNT